MALALHQPGRMRLLTRLALCLTLAAAGASCTHEPDPVGAKVDAAPSRDAATGVSDAAPMPGTGDAGLDAGLDAGTDAGPDAGLDAGLDAGP